MVNFTICCFSLTPMPWCMMSTSGRYSETLKWCNSWCVSKELLLSFLAVFVFGIAGTPVLVGGIASSGSHWWTPGKCALDKESVVFRHFNNSYFLYFLYYTNSWMLVFKDWRVSDPNGQLEGKAIKPLVSSLQATIVLPLAVKSVKKIIWWINILDIYKRHVCISHINFIDLWNLT